ncbi:hypothetical protein [Rariglobus hedericola]|uniref:Uncharacterized protein n=1 Tax=Rariglobus hedericola TaxID=2597822 RepID=A0A556QRH4_9BACT|nr:hypothetical protein [Rariglobus hedericola]TSJ79245.1 hypothetical protein FPL22_08120 [Rariglobus hedericola]
MKKLLTTLLLCLIAWVTRAEDVIPSSGDWLLPKDVYGQFRLVPSKQIRHVTKETEWNGPWSRYPRFSLKVGSEHGHQTSPGDFHYVDPKITLQGFTQTSKETHSTTVKLFDRASRPADIKVNFYPAPELVSLNQDYLAATVSGDNALVTWNLFVRFTEEKPDYIKEAPKK